MSVPRLLLLTRTPPGSGSVGEIILRDLSLQYPRDSLSCFVIESPNFGQAAPELAWLPIVYASRQSRSGCGIPAPYVREIGNFLKHQYSRKINGRKLVREVVAFGRAQGVEIVWANLNHPAVIYIAERVAAELGADLVTMVWDAPERFHLPRHMDGWSAHLMLGDFASALRTSKRCAVISEEMQDEYHTQFGVDTVILRHGLSQEIRQPPATSLVTEDQLILGFAGSLHAEREWQALLEALGSTKWRIAGRTIRIRWMSSKLSLATDTPVNVEFLGWRPVQEVVDLLSQVDVLYLPYPSDPAYSRRLRLSFPTRLTTYLATGRPIFYQGPANLAPARFLREYPAGVCCHSLDAEDIIAALTRFTKNDGSYEQMTATTQLAIDREFTLQVFRQRFAHFLGVNESDLIPAPQYGKQVGRAEELG